jgi:hypothetical protein
MGNNKRFIADRYAVSDENWNYVLDSEWKLWKLTNKNARELAKFVQHVTGNETKKIKITQFKKK